MPMRLEGVRAVVFDLDGTLVDSLADIISHLNDALADHGMPRRAPDVIGGWVGHGAEQLVARAVDDAARAPAVLATFRARYRARPVGATRVFDGIPAVLDALTPGHLLAVLSNKPHDLTVAIVRQLLGGWPFAVVHGQHPDRPRKPDPGSLQRVCAELGVSTGEAVLVGDSEVDLATARSAGARGVTVTWGLRDVASLRAAGAELLVDTPDALAALFAD